MRTDARADNLPAIADYIESSMKQLGAGEDISRVQLAVDEACTNIINHAYADRHGFIDICCEMQGDFLKITIRDRGKPFDPNTVSTPDIGADLEKRKIGGLGMFLMRKFMDDISYSFDEHQGNMLVMRKKISPHR